jgi:hypothetical protein
VAPHLEGRGRATGHSTDGRGINQPPEEPISLSLQDVIARFGGMFSYLPTTNDNVNTYGVEPFEEDLADFDPAAGGPADGDFGNIGFIDVTGDGPLLSADRQRGTLTDIPSLLFRPRQPTIHG